MSYALSETYALGKLDILAGSKIGIERQGLDKVKMSKMTSDPCQGPDVQGPLYIDIDLSSACLSMG